ncbi:hypothetical protein [Hyphomicrobium sp. DY-1]|uniref:hypothetical protein n=1 Tax=Hyphomicrobium sp. DY-1 TaxID=3075650 RepID=UPI0039C0872F
MADYFEENFDKYRPLVDKGRYPDAIEACLAFLQDYRSNNSDYETQHKGSPFYVMGYAAFASHDYSGASLFFDAAVEEDITKFGPTADKPALNFMRLEDKGLEVLASEIVRNLILATEELLTDYNARPGAQAITLSELRSKFLVWALGEKDVHKRALMTTFISFVAEWKYRQRLIGLLANGSREPFFVHLFRGCVLFESLLKENPNHFCKKDMLGPILDDFQTQLNITKVTTGGAAFDTVLKNLTPAMPVQQTIEAAARLRNTVGHKISWTTANLDKDSYELAVKAVASSCIHTISTLY